MALNLSNAVDTQKKSVGDVGDTAADPRTPAPEYTSTQSGKAVDVRALNDQQVNAMLANGSIAVKEPGDKSQLLAQSITSDSTGLGWGAGLSFNQLTRTNIRNDILRISDIVDNRIAANPESGALVSVTVREGNWLAKKQYLGMNVVSDRTTPPVGDFYSTVRKPNEISSFTWVSDTRPSELPSNVSWMTPQQFRGQAAAFVL